MKEGQWKTAKRSYIFAKSFFCPQREPVHYMTGPAFVPHWIMSLWRPIYAKFKTALAREWYGNGTDVITDKLAID